MSKKYKFLITLFIIWYAFFSSGNLNYIYAEDAPVSTPAVEVEEATPPPASETPTVTDTPTPTPEAPTPSPSTVATAEPSATPASLESPSISPTPSPLADVTLPTDTPPADNLILPSPEATESAELLLAAESSPQPENQTAQGSTDNNQDNQNINQSANTTSETGSVSNTGGNTQTSSTSASVQTGQSVSTTDAVTVANLSEVNANLLTVIETILTDRQGDVNLYQKLMDAIANNPNFVPGDVNITVNQTATVSVQANATSTTGGNLQDSGTNTMVTGNATAVSNSVTLVNINMVGGNAVIAVINILGNYTGNIILPNELLLTSLPGQSVPQVNLNSNQSGNTVTTTGADAQTGGNLQESDQVSLMTTGTASSAASSVTLTNIVQVGGGWAYLIINNYGNWTGTLTNWSSPGSSEVLESGTHNLMENYQPQNSDTTEQVTNISSNQESNVTTDVSALSSTGGNTQTGRNTFLNTGDALAIANNFTLANITKIGGSFFMGIVNILGNWSGSIVSAYPRLEVSVSDGQDNVQPGGRSNYTINVRNSGKSNAKNVKLGFNWPKELKPIGPLINNWDIGTLLPGEGKTFNLTGEILKDTPNGTRILASASATTTDTQDDSRGNASEDSTNVVTPVNKPDTRTPDLTTRVWNNVGEFVYVGDTIMASITVKNNSPFSAKSVKVNANVTGASGETVIPLNFDIGDIRPDGQVTASFNLTLQSDIKPGLYTLNASSIGQAENGDSASSNTAKTSFLIKSLGHILSTVVSPVKAEGVPFLPGQVLGTTTSIQSDESLQNKIMRILPLFSLLAAALYITKRRLNKYLKKTS